MAIKLVIHGENLAKDALNQLKADVEKTTKAFNDANSASVSVSDQSERTSASLSGLAMATGAVATALTFVTKGLIESSMRFEVIMKGLTAVTGSAEEAERQFTRLKEVAKLPGLGYEEAVQGSVRLQAVGMSALQAERALKAFGNALATVGLGRVELEHVMYNLMQLSAQTNIMGKDIRDLANFLPQMRTAMKQAFGTSSVEEIRQMGYTSKEFIDKIIIEFEKLPPVSGSIKNSLENLHDTISLTSKQLGDVLAPTVMKVIDKLSELLMFIQNLSASDKRLLTWATVGSTAFFTVTTMALGLTIALPRVVEGLKAVEIALLGVRKATVATELAAPAAGLLANPWVLAAAAVAALAITVYALDKYMDSQRMTAEKYARALGELNDKASKSAALKGMISEYEALRVKMNKTAEETKKMIQLQNDIAKQAPEMIKSFDDKGNAILRTSDELDKYIKKLDAAIQKEKELTKVQAEKEIKQLQKEIAELNKARENVEKSLAKNLPEEATWIERALLAQGARGGISITPESITAGLEKEQKRIAADLKAKSARLTELQELVSPLPITPTTVTPTEVPSKGITQEALEQEDRVRKLMAETQETEYKRKIAGIRADADKIIIGLNESIKSAEKSALTAPALRETIAGMEKAKAPEKEIVSYRDQLKKAEENINAIGRMREERRLVEKKRDMQLAEAKTDYDKKQFDLWMEIERKKLITIRNPYIAERKEIELTAMADRYSVDMQLKSKAISQQQYDQLIAGIESKRHASIIVLSKKAFAVTKEQQDKLFEAWSEDEQRRIAIIPNKYERERQHADLQLKIDERNLNKRLKDGHASEEQRLKAKSALIATYEKTMADIAKEVQDSVFESWSEDEKRRISIIPDKYERERQLADLQLTIDERNLEKRLKDEDATDDQRVKSLEALREAHKKIDADITNDKENEARQRQDFIDGIDREILDSSIRVNNMDLESSKNAIAEKYRLENDALDRTKQRQGITASEIAAIDRKIANNKNQMLIDQEKVSVEMARKDFNIWSITQESMITTVKNKYDKERALENLDYEVKKRDLTDELNMSTTSYLRQAELKALLNELDITHSQNLKEITKDQYSQIQAYATAIAKLPGEAVNLIYQEIQMGRDADKEFAKLDEDRKRRIEQIQADHSKTVNERAKEIEEIERQSAQRRIQIEENLQKARGRAVQDFFLNLLKGVLAEIESILEKRMAKRITDWALDMLSGTQMGGGDKGGGGFGIGSLLKMGLSAGIGFLTGGPVGAVVGGLGPSLAEITGLNTGTGAGFFGFDNPANDRLAQMYGRSAFISAIGYDDPINDLRAKMRGSLTEARNLGHRSADDLLSNFQAGFIQSANARPDSGKFDTSALLEKLADRLNDPPPFILKISGRQVMSAVERETDKRGRSDSAT